jgi:hypothetical protein
MRGDLTVGRRKRKQKMEVIKIIFFLYFLKINFKISISKYLKTLKNILI